jgi:hypothetical protein
MPGPRRRKFSAPGCTHLDRRRSHNFFASDFTHSLLGDAGGASARSSMTFWPAIIVLRRISDIGISDREAAFPGC